MRDAARLRLREMIATNLDLARRFEELEKRYDAQFKGVFDAIRQLMAHRRSRGGPSASASRRAGPPTGRGGKLRGPDPGLNLGKAGIESWDFAELGPERCPVPFFLSFLLGYQRPVVHDVVTVIK